MRVISAKWVDITDPATPVDGCCELCCATIGSPGLLSPTSSAWLIVVRDPGVDPKTYDSPDLTKCISRTPAEDLTVSVLEDYAVVCVCLN